MISKKLIAEFCSGITPTGRIFNIWEHRAWGNRIAFTDDYCREIGGAFRGLRVGDEIRWENAGGGNEIRCKLIVKIRYSKDPTDCFFGTLAEGSSFRDRVVVSPDGRLALGKKGKGSDVPLDATTDPVPAERI